MLNINIKTWIFVIIVVFLFIFIMIVVTIMKYKNAVKLLQSFPNFKKFKNKNYDFVIENETKKLYIKMIDIPSNSMITINSKTTWCLSYGGSSSNPGRAFPNKRYLEELKPFLKEQINDIKNYEKIILLNKSTEKIVRYLNESELEVVNYCQRVYDYKIISVDKINEHLNNLGIY